MTLFEEYREDRRIQWEKDEREEKDFLKEYALIVSGEALALIQGNDAYLNEVFLLIQIL